MKQSFTLRGRLPSFNDYQKACRANRYIGAKMKKQEMERVSWVLKDLKPYIEPVSISIKWYEETARRDIDGITSFGCKVILDALVNQKVLKDDSQRYVKQINNTILNDKKNPRIEVIIDDGI